MSQHKTRAGVIALLTVASGLVAAAPTLLIPSKTSAAEWALSNTHRALCTRGERGIMLRRTTKNRKGIGDPNQRGLRAIGDPNIRAIGDPNTRWLKGPLPPGPR